jgi:hypothetical protein
MNSPHGALIEAKNRPQLKPMKAKTPCSDLNERGRSEWGGGSGTETHVALSRSKGRCTKSGEQGREEQRYATLGSFPRP